MSGFPKIESPCPLRWKTLPSAGKNFCTHCSRQVHNLDAMSAAQRRAFLASCSGQTCVAYRMPRPRRANALAAGLGLAAALSVNVAIAADATADAASATTSSQPSSPALVTARADDDAMSVDADAADSFESIDTNEMLMVGGISPPLYEIEEEEEEEEEEEPNWLDSDLPELLLDDPDDLREPAEFVEPPALT